jgi:hypothetical protein
MLAVVSDQDAARTADWRADVELAGQLDDEQLEDLASDAPIIHYNTASHVLRLQFTVHADDVGAAAREALAAVDRMPAVQRLIAGEVLGAPRALHVQDTLSHAAGLPLIDATEAARRLGVTPGRLRHLRAGNAEFPKPVLTLSGGVQVYEAAAVDAFARKHRRPGRPSKTAD